jgi:hypothetical protein
MKAVNLQLRKMNLIEYLLGVQDEKVFAKIESTIHKSMKDVKPADIVFTKQDIVERAEFANKQIKKGHVLTQKELEQQSKNW